jgi:diguanylate cyclase (GGDEF)-like protein/PAS domain S-box-containing protein
MLKIKNSHQSKDDLLFAEDTTPQLAKTPDKSTEAEQTPWKLMIIDDEKVLHALTRLVFDGFTFKGRTLQLISAYSGKEAKRLIQQHPDIHVMLLDVVMETEDAGLKFVHYVRNELKNQFVRIILRTGQPGQAPENKVIIEYDINDYKEKSDLTAQKLVTAVTAALRSYNDLKTIEQLVTSNDQLEQLVSERTCELQTINQQLEKEIEERIQAEEDLKLSKDRLLSIINNSTALIGLKDTKGQYILVNRQYEALFNVNNQNIQGKTDYDLLPTEVADRLVENDKKVLEASKHLQFEEEMPHEDGLHTYISVKFPLFDTQGIPYRVCSISTDITERKRSEEKMRQLSSALEQTADIVLITDKNGIIEYVNQGFERVTGYRKVEAQGRKPAILNSGKQSRAFYKTLWETILGGEVFSDIFINRNKEGGIFYEEKTITPLKDSKGNITHFIATGKDISKRMANHERILLLAHHDGLTNLPNRLLLEDRLKQAVARMRWHKRSVALFFMDMDRFKIINDTLGHEVGDQVLQTVSKRLLDCVREGDTVARIGGDEFAIILNDIASKDDILPIAQHLLENMAQPFICNERELFISSSIGISLFPTDGEDTQTLLKKADIAMYQAKAQGGNNYRFYTKEDDEKAAARLSLETSLRRALEKEEFIIHYQPQLDLRTGKIVGVEALLRWQPPKLNMVAPMHFIPLMEEVGLILPVGEWVLRNVCQQGKIWQDVGSPLQRIAVNISSYQLQQQDLVKKIERILQETGFKAQNLVLEISETVLVKNVTETAHALQQLHETGVVLAIDNFGTGSSSMNYLKRLPFNMLKIDNSLMSEISDNPNNAAICAGIITLAHGLKLKVIAEGVETLEQLEVLKAQGCDEIQGYFCSHPIATEAIAKFIHSNNGNVSLLLGGK